MAKRLRKKEESMREEIPFERHSTQKGDSTKTLWIIMGIVLVILVVGLVWFFVTQPTEPTVNETNETGEDEIKTYETLYVGTGSLPMLGEEDAKIIFIEFSDYECPYCNRFFLSTLPSIKQNFVDTGKVKYYFRDFPLTSIHSKALDAAMAARCANEYGKFWEMHDLLGNNAYEGDGWAYSSEHVSLFKNYAEQLEMDGDEFSRCVEERKYLDDVAKDYTAGIEYGVSGTPTTYILLPKNKTNLSEIEELPDTYPNYITIYENENEYIVKVVGAFEYELFPIIFGSYEE